MNEVFQVQTQASDPWYGWNPGPTFSTFEKAQIGAEKWIGEPIAWEAKIPVEYVVDGSDIQFIEHPDRPTEEWIGSSVPDEDGWVSREESVKIVRIVVDSYEGK